jgi:site-specific DNA recombinase
VFDGMVARIERGEAEGIIALSPDRLARNSVDGGRIVYLLDTGVLKDLKFSTHTFENNPQGKMMLQIMFAQSKHFSDALSVRIRLANQKKLNDGWRPSRAPIGYLNERADKTIVVDPARFPFVREMFVAVLSDTYTPRQLVEVARDTWGLRAPKTARRGGRPLALSTIYKILNSEFYAGLIRWNGELYQGKHTPVVSVAEFEAVQRKLKRPGRPRPQKHRFAYTGVMRCGQCNRRITAEKKVNAYGAAYTYYHCTRRNTDGRPCREPAIEERLLEQQLSSFLGTLVLPPIIAELILKALVDDDATLRAAETERVRSVDQALADTTRQLTELTGLRLRQLLSDEEYVAQRRMLEETRLKLANARGHKDTTSEKIELLKDVVLFRNEAAFRLEFGNDDEKRTIIETVGSNFFLEGRKLSIQAAKPFLPVSDLPAFLRRCRVVNDVQSRRRNSSARDDSVLVDESEIDTEAVQSFISELSASLDGPEGPRLRECLTALKSYRAEGQQERAS